MYPCHTAFIKRNTYTFSESQTLKKKKKKKKERRRNKCLTEIVEYFFQQK